MLDTILQFLVKTFTSQAAKNLASSAAKEIVKTALDKNNNNLRLLQSRHTAQPTQRHNQQAATQDSTSTSTGTQARYNNNRV